MSAPLIESFDPKIFFAAAKFEKKTTHFRKKQVIFSQGDRSEALFYIENGTVKLTVVSQEGKEAIVSVASGGSFFGESCISSNQPLRSQSAIALTNVQLIKIDASRLKEMIVAGGVPTMSFVAFLLAQSVRIQSDLANRIVDSSAESLARVISSLVQFRDRQGRMIPPKVSQQTLAEMIGVSRQQVNALLKRLKKSESPSLSSVPSSKSSLDTNSASDAIATLNSSIVQQRDRRRRAWEQFEK
jgi:CRP-like cAMP-binding protein